MGLKEHLTRAGQTIVDVLRDMNELERPDELLRHLSVLYDMYPQLSEATISDSPIENSVFSRANLMRTFGIKSARRMAHSYIPDGTGYRRCPGTAWQRSVNAKQYESLYVVEVHFLQDATANEHGNEIYLHYRTIPGEVETMFVDWAGTMRTRLELLKRGRRHTLGYMYIVGDSKNSPIHAHFTPQGRRITQEELSQ
ncbi:hypothetical protein COT62_02040 [Candidatus Roizmanbacteria bacterium CG09_land_8_20_14_0_10_41_9]|uniref:Uncharacterized protein n=1 Tax=Candidatus Roizmanbacteria bacterium CG09_land_8_20_14_0_10_41_9 TaxID=1974850 RepID=A0A2H0WUZ1_9BACT|nr:MAG: hypothetical protein COT62_02040 [Candidatus Roizmanbacteria bacterium CG09_land_8_20_14_0_10_41_9]